MRKLLIASNRLPVTIQTVRGEPTIMPSSGGLATALRGHARAGALWFGWPGEVSHASGSEVAALDAKLAELGTVPVHLSPAQVAHYYDGFSNSVLWPLLHYLLDKVQLDAEHDWSVYCEVNRRFAERLAAAWRPGDTIWVHDYQLALVPAYLRELVPEARIGFFLHVPFPSADVFRILPWCAPILEGMLGADLVGFHTAGYRRNFCDAVAQVLRLRPRSGKIQVGHRVVSVSVHPIGVDVAAFDRAARSKSVAADVESLRQGAMGKTIFLGVDRLDYTKGLLRRLHAFDRFLERSPELRDKVLFIQLAVPSREKVDTYAEFRRSVNELVGRINSHHGSPTGGPLQLLYRSVDHDQLVGLYRAADVMLVTPVRDGMNLVAKEYVASRVDERGVLVLSEFAGAAAELTEAIVVNPHDLAGVASAMHRAMDMPADEQRARMRTLRARVALHDVHAWVDGFLGELESGERASGVLPEDDELATGLVA